MDSWFMVSHEVPNNNMEVALYFLRNLWEKFMLGLHVIYFDIGEFQRVGLGSSQDWENSRWNPMLGPHPPRWHLIPFMQHLPIGRRITQTSPTNATMIDCLVHHSYFIELSCYRPITGDVWGVFGPSFSSKNTSQERLWGASPKTHRCQSCGNSFFFPL